MIQDESINDHSHQAMLSEGLGGSETRELHCSVGEKTKQGYKYLIFCNYLTDHVYIYIYIYKWFT